MKLRVSVAILGVLAVQSLISPLAVSAQSRNTVRQYGLPPTKPADLLVAPFGKIIGMPPVIRTPAQTAAVDRISQQTAAEHRNLDRLSSAGGASFKSGGDAAAAAIVAEGERAVKQMRSATFTTQFGERLPFFSQAEIAEKQQYFKELAETTRRNYNQQSELFARSCDDRRHALDDAAANLKDQLTSQPTNHNSAILQPVGTSLYVRNYQPAGIMDPVDAYAAPVRAAAGVYPTNSRSYVTPASASQQSIQPTRGRVMTRLSGKLLKHS
jgi:hypothetical protein